MSQKNVFPAVFAPGQAAKTKPILTGQAVLLKNGGS